MPEGWKSRKIKYTFLERNQKNFPYEPLLAATQNHGVILKSEYENRTVEATKALDVLKLVEVGDFVISLRSFQGGIELSYRRGIISPAYTILIPTHVERCYFKYLAKSPSFISLLKSKVTGIREGQNIDYNKLRDELMPIPPVDEQKRMGAYLDETTGKIDKAIAAEERLIELLQERKQIIINEAVGGDLSRAEAQRGSELPKGWNERRLKNTTTGGKLDFVDGDWIESDVIESSGIRYLTTGNVGAGFYKEQGNSYISKATFEKLNCTEVFPGDLLISRLNEPVGRTCIVPELGDRIVVAVDNVIYRPNESLLKKKYLVYLLNSKQYADYMNLIARGSTMHRISRSMLGNVKIVFPPLPEQKAIVKYLDEETGKIDRAIEVKRRQIALLRERREIIIDEVVTGKVKVA